MNDSRDALSDTEETVPAARTEPVAGKEAFLAELSAFRRECGNPSGSVLARISRDLPHLYPPAAGSGWHLPGLSSTAISEVLAGRRKGPPSGGWVASFVLSCQHHASRIGIVTADPGISSLRAWQARLRQAQADGAGWDGDAPVPPQPAHAPLRLPPHRQAFVADHGPYGDELLAEAEAGHPDAIYQVALLLATDPDCAGDAQPLLVRAAAAGHQPSMDLLDDSPGDCVPAPAAARCAFALALAAETDGRADEARAFYQAAARGGVPDAALKHAAAVLEKLGEPQVAAWLAAAAIPPDSTPRTSSSRP